MKKVLIVSGKKRSGKDSLCNFITGYHLNQLGVFREFGTDANGDLFVNSAWHDTEGKVEESMGLLDLKRKDEDFLHYAHSVLWPHIKSYSYADYLKEICMNLFSLTKEQCYGTTEDKNSLTNIKWEDLLGVMSSVDWSIREGQFDLNVPPPVNGYAKHFGLLIREGLMTAREVLQYFGTEVCRAFNQNCWVDYVCNAIVFESSNWALISDGRFLNEIDVMKERLEPLDYDVKAVYLKRQMEAADGHKSETELDDCKGFDLVVSNEDMTLKEKNSFVLKEGLLKWGWV